MLGIAYISHPPNIILSLQLSLYFPSSFSDCKLVGKLTVRLRHSVEFSGFSRDIFCLLYSNRHRCVPFAAK